jgi:phosphoribosylglycinamide formyltransferase-1
MLNHKTRLAVFCSGAGSNFRALHRAIAEKPLDAEIVLCLSNRSQCGAMEYAREHGIAAVHLSEKQYETYEAFVTAMLGTLLFEFKIEAIMLAGYMRRIPEAVVAAYPDRMLNIHPALLPKFGGEGMYGIHVHTAVLAAGEQESGATVHIVSEEYDKGRIVLQKKVPVLPGDTPETLGERVLECEHRLYPEALEILLREMKARKP